jgi:dTDP-4-amino-4,6-dideoxygalactose transaminase
LWKPMHVQPVFKQYPFFGAGIAESLFENGLCLPSGTNIPQSDLLSVTRIISALFGR